MKKLIIQIVLLIAIVFLGYKVYNSIMEPVRYQKATSDREEVIISKLNSIKLLQIEYKKLNADYSSSFDTLKSFYTDGEIPLVLKNGVVPDNLSEEQALAMGIITRDTTLIAVKDTLLKGVEGFDISIIDIVPFTHGNVKFELETSTVERANFKIPVFEVRCYKKDYLADINELDLLKNDLNLMKENDKFPGLKLGSITEPSTDGNW